MGRHRLTLDNIDHRAIIGTSGNLLRPKNDGAVSVHNPRQRVIALAQLFESER